eukprot:1160185-Pelagomonas_calceolata.AAC.9
MADLLALNLMHHLQGQSRSKHPLDTHPHHHSVNPGIKREAKLLSARCKIGSKSKVSPVSPGCSPPQPHFHTVHQCSST